MNRVCCVCAKELPPNRWRYCSHQCYKLFSRQKYKGKYRQDNPYKGISRPTTGAISELRVAADLLSKGFNVFRSLSPTCPCDLAILKNDSLLKVEVKTTYWATSGKFYKPKNRKDTSKTVDIYAWVLPDKIIYEPDI